METLKITTFNVRCVYDGTADGIRCFVNRLGLILRIVRRETPDVIGFQEVTEEIARDLEASLPEYSFVFSQRGSDLAGEGLMLALRKDTVRLWNLDFFWLSPTPRVPGSRYEIQSDCPRVCQNAVILRLSDRKRFRVYNNHLDHISDEAREQGMAQVLETVDDDYARDPMPLFILGDMNAEPQSLPMNLCRTHKKPALVDLTEGLPGTYHGFGTVSVKIDYIWTDRKTAKGLKAARLWDDCLHGMYPSDHYPVQADIRL